MKSVVFIGHNECYGLSYEKLEKVVTECINDGVVNFYSGGQGGFDRTCAGMINRLKKQYAHIKNILVIPYLTFNIFDKEIFDEIIYPESFENYYFKAAIIKRNKYMVEKSQTAICYINKNFGGAIKTYEYAVQKNLKIINLA